MPKHISDADPTAIKVVMITLDGHLGGATERARESLKRSLPGLSLRLHAATDWKNDADALLRCQQDIADGDIIVPSMLFMEEHFQPVLADLEGRRTECDALVSIMSAGEVMRLTRMGKFAMDGSSKGPMAFLKRLRGQRKAGTERNSGEKQLAMLRRIPQMLRFIPGTAQDVRAYFLTMQYFLASSEENIEQMVRFLVNRYADGPRRGLRGRVNASAPIQYPDVGLYHPRIPGRVAAEVGQLPPVRGPGSGRVGLLLMRSYVLSGDSAHYDGVIDALEARGCEVVPAFAGGLDSRSAVERFFVDDGRPSVDAVVSLTGFSLVGGPAYNDSGAAEQTLTGLDVPYLAAHALEFQSLEQWQQSERGLNPVESTMMVALPELDGATGPLVYGGRSDQSVEGSSRRMESHPERAAMLAERVTRLMGLRRKPRSERRIGIVLFSFPPQAGAVGTAAYLSVFESLHRTLKTLAAAGYDVEVPADVAALRRKLLDGDGAAAGQEGAHANILQRIPVDRHVAGEPWLAEIESQWGPAPGRQLSDGRSLFVLGARFGKVLVTIQPGFGYEGDPMRLLFEKGLAPTHAFAAHYRYLREDFQADALLHFGTHGALEFMPGKQSGMSGDCWPDRLIGAVPNFYLYAANNPSEGTIAKRRSAATLITYMPPPVARAGLYKGLQDLKASLDRWRATVPENLRERESLAALIHAQAIELDLLEAQTPLWNDPEQSAAIETLHGRVLEYEYTLIPEGLHVLGEPFTPAARIEVLQAMAETVHQQAFEPDVLARVVAGEAPEDIARDCPAASVELLTRLADSAHQMAGNQELQAVVAALDGRYIAPAPGGDLLRNPEVMPSGRNMHGFDPFRLPSAFAVCEGERQAQLIIDKHLADGHPPPRSIAMVLWGTDNLKNEGVPIAQALALIGARPRFDGYGRLVGATLVPVSELGRPRIDVVLTLSGIFRDLLPLQTRVLAEAAYLAAAAEDESAELNPIRANTLAYQARHGCDFETAALRVYGNADGAYGANVNAMIDGGCWQEEDELAETYTRRKCFAYGRQGLPVARPELLGSQLQAVDLAYQNLESIELGVTTVDHYFDTLGGISSAVQRARGESVPVYIGDQTRGEGKVRTLSDQVALETRTRMLNPKWYEGLLAHGYEGVHQIEVAITNTMGWSATTGQVAPWVYQQVTQTYMLDEAMRARLAELNPAASAKLANRLLEAHERNYWSPDPEMLDALRRAGDELEDRLEGITEGVAA